jgi:hypothetical protein
MASIFSPFSCTHEGSLTCNFVCISLKLNHGYVIGYWDLFVYNLFANALSLFCNGVLGASRVSISMGNTFLGPWGSNPLQAFCKLWCLFGLQNLTCFRGTTSELVGTWSSTWFFPQDPYLQVGVNIFELCQFFYSNRFFCST